MADPTAIARPALTGLAPPPEKGASFFAQLAASDANVFELLPRAVFETPIHRKGKSPLLMVHDPDGIRRVLVENVANYPKEKLSDEFFTAMFGEGLLSAAPAKWRRHRKIMAGAFDPRSVAAYAPTMAAEANAYAQRWAQLPEGAEIDVAEAMKALTLRIICETMFSSDAEELTALAGTALGFSSDALVFSLLDVIPVIGPMRMKAKKAKIHNDFSAMDGAIYRMIEARRANLDAAPNDLLTRLLAARDAEDGSGLSAQEIRDEVITIFEAGHETTAVAMTFTFYLLSAHPAEAAKLHAELDAVLGGRAPAPEDLPNLVYTRRVVEEAMRLYPPAPAVTGRVAAGPDEICGHKVKKGDRIFISTWVMHRHRAYWDEPERFDPDRFSPERSEGRPRFAYMPFGAGPRVCIGAAFAMTEATLILAALAQKVRLRMDRPQDVELLARITLAPKDGLKMTLEHRAAAS
ncbi:cytochrome P450 [Phenylobacterium sp.]|uniref:cytochrome P450 n=1 Tax=Phenylobacterium sp. TaxID=1871053 RepID=UPI0025D01F95|nr:cytochrome P450 [Phenylobacterium sp.]